MLKNVLITGAFGYVGGRLSRHLAQLPGYRVVLATRRVRPPPPWLADAVVLQTPWQSEDALTRACEGIDAVVHLAGVNAQDSLADPVGALEMNGVATARLVRAAARAGVKRCVHVSTAHVYGTLQGSISEASPAAGKHPYAASHRAGEDAVLFARAQRTIEGVTVRLSNSFGPPVDGDANCWTLLINDLARQAVREKKIVLRTSGLQRRDFVALPNVARALTHLIEIEEFRLGDGLYNVGGAWAPTVLQTAERVAECCRLSLGYRPEISRLPPSPGETSPDLDYGIEKLSQTGFELHDHTDEEIVATLRFCATQGEFH